MPVVDVYNLERSKVGTLELKGDVFDVEVREHLFYDAVLYQLAKRRSGTAKVKGRAEVNGSTIKAYRQKGTGRARQGMRKAPHWVGGGVAFGPQPRDFAHKMNKKARRAALCSALSRRQQEGRLLVLDKFELPEIKTRRVADVLKRFELEKALIIDVANDKLSLSTRNLERTKFLAVDGLNVYDILLHDTLVLTQDAARAIEGRLGK